MQLKLKINVCSLMAESKLIRKEVERIKADSPQKGNDPKCQELIHHRRCDLRNESRATQLVYAFVRNVPYFRLEATADRRAWKWYDTMKRAQAKCKKLKLDYDDFLSWTNVEVKVG